MKLVHGLSAALLGTTLLAGAATARDRDNQSSHPHFSAQGHSQGREDIVRTTGNPTGRPQSYTPRPNRNFNATANANANVNSNANWAAHNGNSGNRNWNHNSGGGNRQPHWNSNNLRDHNVAHFNPQDRTRWQHGHWRHGRHHGRNGWWWNTGGVWFFYDQPVYPYPGYVSNDYYADDYYDDGDPGYADDAGGSGYYWYYCNNPAGYYPYVKSCRGPWRAVTPTPDAQQGYDQNDGPDADDDRGPPPGAQVNGPDDDQGPPPGYNSNQNGAPGYNDDDRGPPPGYGPDDNGPDDEDDGPPPPPR